MSTRIPGQLNDLEARKFLLDSSGEVTVRTLARGTFSFSGLSIAGKITEVSLSSGAWTALPATPLTDRNAICIQNLSGTDIKVNYDNSESGYVGITIANGNERFYDITDTIIIYAKAASGTPTITIEELS